MEEKVNVLNVFVKKDALSQAHIKSPVVVPNVMKPSGLRKLQELF